MSLLSRLFGSGASREETPVAIEYKGFSISPAPMREGTRFRLSALIEKEVGGEMFKHQLVRADVLDSHDDAAEAAIRKARQMIDEQGERLFN